MAILTSVNGSHGITGTHFIESGTGKFIYNSGLTGATDVILTADKLQFPFPIADGGSLEVIGGFIAIITTITEPAAPIAEFTSGDEVTSVAAADIQGGSGAILLKNVNGDLTDEIYVRLNNLKYPFEYDAVGSAVISYKVLGENSIVLESTPA